MQDLAFYTAGCEGNRGPRRVLVLMRRLLRRLLRPFFFRLVELFQHVIDRLDRNEKTVKSIRDDVDGLARRQDELEQRVEMVLAFGWDYVAMVRRLAVLEDQVAALSGYTAATSDEADPRPSILFPSLDPALEGRSKVC